MPLVCAGTTIASGAELARLFSYDYAQLPYFARFEKLRARMDYLLDGYETRRAAQISEAITASEGFIDRRSCADAAARSPSGSRSPRGKARAP